MQVLVLVAGAALIVADESVLPFLRTPDRGQSLGLFLVLTSQLIDLALEILVALQHVPHDDVATVAAFLGLFVLVGAEVAVGVVLFVSLHLLLQPDVFLD